jgi:alcohol dehydrogenase
MRALRLIKDEQLEFGEIDDPRPPGAHDVLVRVRAVSLNHIDLFGLRGMAFAKRTLPLVVGVECSATVEKLGGAVSGFREGDKVLISCITSCGKCDCCRKGMLSHCRNGGWNLGHTIDGTQAEYVRIPHADTSLHAVPRDADEEAIVMLSDIFPTAYECGVQNGRVEPGDSVAIVGAGPIGLAALLTAQFYAPGEIVMIDVDDNRLEVARSLGATRTVNSSGGKAVEAVMALTGGAGVDVAIEAVGIPATFDICQAVVAPGGRIANVGVHGKPVELRLERLWAHNIALTTRLVDTVTTPMLLKLVRAGRLQPKKLATHRFALGDVMQAYDTFANAARERALKVILRNA